MGKELTGTPGHPIFTFSQAPVRHKPRYVVKSGVLTSEECAFLVRHGQKRWDSKDKRLVVPAAEKGRVVDDCAIYPEDLGRRAKLWDKIAEAMGDKKVNPWGLILTGINEPFQLLRYRQGGVYVPHTDYEYAINDRSKLTMILFLRDASTYQGGDLHVVNSVAPRLRKGDAIFFPSLLVHSVTPVLSGERMVLGGWATGPDFM